MMTRDEAKDSTVTKPYYIIALGFLEVVTLKTKPRICGEKYQY